VLLIRCKPTVSHAFQSSCTTQDATEIFYCSLVFVMQGAVYSSRRQRIVGDPWPPVLCVSHCCPTQGEGRQRQSIDAFAPIQTSTRLYTLLWHGHPFMAAHMKRHHDRDQSSPARGLGTVSPHLHSIASGSGHMLCVHGVWLRNYVLIVFLCSMLVID
jgi:hypothetical protein